MGLRLRRIVSAATFIRLAVSVALAMIIWGFIVWETNPEITRTFQGVPVTPEAVPSDMLIVGGLPQVTVTVKGPEDVVEPITASDVSASIDFSDGGSPGIDEYEIDVDAPSGVRQVLVDPSTIEVELDLIVTRTFPTRLRENEPRPASVTSIDAATQIVSVEGPQELVDRVDAVELVIDHQGRQESYTDEGQVVPVSDQGEPVEGVVVSPATIEYSVTFESTAKDVPVIAVCACVVEDQLVERVLTNAAAIPSTVRLSGPSSALETVSEIRTTPIDITSLTESGWVLDVELDITTVPDNVNYSDQTVDVWVPIDPNRIEVPDVPVKTLGLESGLEASLSIETVTVIVSGGTNVDTEALGISAVVDLTGYVAGAYTVEVSIAVPPEVSYDQVFPRTVRVVIQPISTTANRLREFDPTPPGEFR